MGMVKWKSEGEGYWVSKCGRFSIKPLYWGRTSPQEYDVEDRQEKMKDRWDRVRDCKKWCEEQVEAVPTKEVKT